MALGEHKICCYIRMQTNKQTQKLWKRAINKLENELHHWNIIYIFTLWHYNWKFINKKKRKYLYYADKQHVFEVPADWVCLLCWYFKGKHLNNNRLACLLFQLKVYFFLPSFRSVSWEKSLFSFRYYIISINHQKKVKVFRLVQ